MGAGVASEIEMKIPEIRELRTDALHQELALRLGQKHPVTLFQPDERFDSQLQDDRADFV